jgi:hypothetical protein
MPLITTTLHHRYQPNLDAIWACREIGSNAIDGEERHRHLGVGEMSIEYSARGKTLTIRNEGITVPMTALLMGTSDSREESGCIGQFGEGLPMALLVLARSDIPVTVINGDEKWEPVLLRSDVFNNEPVLAVKTRKLLKDRKAFEIQIKGIDKEDYAEFCSRFLRLDPLFDEEQTVKQQEHSKERVLLQAKYHGRIYNKGVFVCEREDLMFGYDLHTELNRDRSMMDEWDLKNNLARLLSRTIEANDEHFTDLVTKAMFEEDGRLELDNEYSDLFHSAQLREKVVKLFVEKYGQDAVAVEHDWEVEEATELGLRGVHCSRLLGRMIRKQLGTLGDIKTARRNSITKVWRQAALSGAERHNLCTVKLLVQAVMPNSRDYDFGVVSFTTEETKFFTKAENSQILLAHGHLLDFETTLRSAVLGAIALDTHTFQTTADVLSAIVGQLSEGKGTAALALQLLGQEA